MRTHPEFDPDAHFWGWEALPRLDRALLATGGILLGSCVGLVLALVRLAL